MARLLCQTITWANDDLWSTETAKKYMCPNLGDSFEYVQIIES